MAVVRIVFWLILAGLYAAFASENWTQVPLVFGDTEVLIRLPALILAALLIGFLPTYIAYRVARGRRARSIAETPVVAAAAPVRMPSEAQPTVAPPGCG